MVAAEVVWLVVALAVVAALLLMPLVAVGRVAWRVFHDDEQPEPGGSLGRQLFGRDRRRGSAR